MKYLLIVIGLLLSSLAHAQTSRNPCYSTGAGSGTNCIGVGDSSPLPVSEFYQKVAEGKVAGYTSEVRLGFNPAVGLTSELISGTGAALPYMPTVATTVEVLSSSVNDTLAGTGVRTVLVVGLDANFNELSEVINLNGVTPVVSTNSFIRVFQVTSIGAGTYRGTNAGDITVRASGGGTVFVVALAGQGVSLSFHYTVPARKTLFVHWFFIAIEGSKNAEISFWVGPNADIISPPYLPVLAVGRAGGLAAVFQQTFSGLSGEGGISEKTDIYVTAVAAASTAAITAQTIYILKDN